MRTVGVGFGFGLLVAAGVGPVWLLCARSVLRTRDLTIGLAIGAGAAVVDTCYAALGIAGAARLLDIGALRVILGFAGAGVIGGLGLRSLRSAWRVRAGIEADDEVATRGAAFRTALAVTASNPMTIASWAAVFAAASAGGVVDGTAAAVALLAGVAAGSLTWFAVLSTGVAVAGRRAGPRAIATADALSGIALVGFGGALAWRSITDAR
jgi:putative LysE/RhtB family amino acid efflux pump